MENEFLRKHKRINFSVEMIVHTMYKQDYKVLDGVDAVIDLFDISKGGVGFYSETDLPKAYYFNAEIVCDGEHHFKAVLKIVRKEKVNDKFEYGCEFVGLASNLASMIDDCLSE